MSFNKDNLIQTLYDNEFNVPTFFNYYYFALVDRADPYFTVTASHFNSLMARSGAPLIILNLVKVSDYYIFKKYFFFV